MKRMAFLATALLAGGLLWAARPSRVSASKLVEGLNGSDAVNCFSELRQMEDDKTDEAIVAGTKHSSARVRGQCARLLGQRQDVNMVAVLAPMVSDPDPSVRNLAARSLLPLLDDEEMVELLRSDKLPPGSQIVMLAALLRDPLALTNASLLDWALDRKHGTEVRVGCYVNLRNHHCPSFGQKRAEKEQLSAVQAARQRITRQARADAYDDACPEEVRCAALPLYAALQGPAVYEEVLTFLKHPVPALREASLLALASTHDIRTWALFCRLAVDSRQPLGFRVSSLHGLRYLARSLGKEKEKEAFPILCRIAEDGKEPVEVRAVALASLRPYRYEQEALRIARAAIQAPEPLLRQKAAFCLAGLGDWNAPPESPFYLEPSLKLVQDSLARESDAEAKCAMQGAVCSLEGRIANRGK